MEARSGDGSRACVEQLLLAAGGRASSVFLPTRCLRRKRSATAGELGVRALGTSMGLEGLQESDPSRGSNHKLFQRLWVISASFIQTLFV